MFQNHISRQLAALADGQLNELQVKRAEHHLQKCSRCQAEQELIEQGMTAIEILPVIEAPAEIWFSIQARLDEKRPQVILWRWVFAASIVLVLAGAIYTQVARSTRPKWEVLAVSGTPSLDAKPLRGAGSISAGEWIETDSVSRAAVKVGSIGSVELAPNTRLRVVTTRTDEHRVTLQRGEIAAKITAPPKLFFVETGSGTAVDLGCEYTMSIDERGAGLLNVTKGWVAFQFNHLESLVPAGAMCRLRPQAGPQVPYFDDAPASLKQAIEAGILTEILSSSRARDTLTLWHLLPRVSADDRAQVFERMAALAPPPTGVSRVQILSLEPDALRRWKEELAWSW